MTPESFWKVVYCMWLVVAALVGGIAGYKLGVDEGRRQGSGKL